MQTELLCKDDMHIEINEYSLLRNEQQSRRHLGKGVLSKLDCWDKAYSNKIHTMSVPLVELPMLVCGYLFNRLYVFVSVILSGLFTYWYPGFIIKHLSVSTQKVVIDNKDKILQLAFGFAFINILLILGVLTTTQILKRILNRKRPISQNDVYRLIHLSEKEIGTLSMPSGDTAQCAMWCGIIQLFFKTNIVLFLIPFVALGRIYYQCHWIGDTLVGALIGLTWAAFAFTNFFIFEFVIDIFVCV